MSRKIIDTTLRDSFLERIISIFHVSYTKGLPTVDSGEAFGLLGGLYTQRKVMSSSMLLPLLRNASMTVFVS